MRHVFIMAGAVPNTSWLERCVVLDDKGFIKTSPDISPEDLAAAGWPLPRPPYLLETSRPGVFAVGDVRGGMPQKLCPSWKLDAELKWAWNAWLLSALFCNQGGFR
jgi:thioredoxin reductase (NADPH)